jgi:hypothetical protein
MTFSDGTPSTVSEMLAARRQRISAIMADWQDRKAAGRVRHPGLGEPHERITSGLGPELNRTPCPDCGGGYWQEYIGPPPSDRYIVHDSICPVVAS